MIWRVCERWSHEPFDGWFQSLTAQRQDELLGYEILRRQEEAKAVIMV
jgi:hypothetical protein